MGAVSTSMKIKVLLFRVLPLAFVAAAPLAFSQTKVVTNFTTAGTPVVAVYNGNVFMAFTGMDAKVYVAESSDGVDFGSATAVANAISSGVGPGLASFNGYLFLAWTGGYDDINIMSSSNGTSFGNKEVYSNMTSVAGPRLGVQNGELWLAYANTAGYHYLTLAESPDGVNFSTPLQNINASLIDNFNNQDVDAPTLSNAPFGSNPSVLWLGATVWGNTSHSYFNLIQAEQEPSGYGINIQVNPPGYTSTTGIGITSLGNYVYLAYLPNGSETIQLNTYELVNNELDLVSSVSTGHLTDVADPTLLTYNGHIYLYWVGTDSAHHINAIEVQ